MIGVFLAIVGVALSQSPEQIWIEASDGGWVAAHRYERVDAQPIVLVHGISSNHHFWDLQPGRSLALALYDRGYDVWNVDLRGHGAALRNPEGRRQRPGWTLDTYGAQDLPAVFGHIEKETGSRDIGYVGHSMGGMVLAIYLARHAETPLSSAVVVGSPMRFDDPDLTVQTMLTGAPFFRYFAFLPTPMLARLLSHFHQAFPLHLEEFLYNPENIEPEVARRMLREIVSPLSRGEIQHFAGVESDGRFRSADGEYDYAAAMHQVDLPILFLAGRADRIAAPDRVWSFFNDLGTDDKAFEVLSVANGQGANYGHLDFGIGRSAAEEVFPRIIEWFEQHP